MGGPIPCFSDEFDFCCFHRRWTQPAPAGWKFPSEAVQDVTVLPNQSCAAFVIDRCDGDADRFHSDAVVRARKAGPKLNGIAPDRKIGTRKLLFSVEDGPRIGFI